PPAHYGADMAGAEEALDAVRRGLQNAGDGRRHGNVRDQQGEVPQPQSLCLKDRHGVSGRGRLESDGEEHDLPLRIVPRDLQTVHWRIDDPDVASIRPDLE